MPADTVSTCEPTASCHRLTCHVSWKPGEQSMSMYSSVQVYTPASSTRWLYQELSVADAPAACHTSSTSDASSCSEWGRLPGRDATDSA